MMPVKLEKEPLPENTAVTVFNPELPAVLKAKSPLLGAVHRHQSDPLAFGSHQPGSSASSVAKALVPRNVPLVVDQIIASAKLSLGGGT